jgi:ABC-type Fe3+/spermidine/putrescine transport system ATPase subunit/ABC-type sulfate transport system permease component
MGKVAGARSMSRKPLQFLAGLLIIYLAFPVMAFLDRLVRSHQRGFGVPGLWSALIVSVTSSTISLAIMTILGVPLAFVLARSRSRLSTVAYVAVLLPLALPPIMSGILLIYLIGPYSFLGLHLDRNLTQSMAGIVIAQTFVSAPFVVVAAKSAFENVDPALDGLAATLGHRPLARFWMVDVHSALPGIRAGMALAWLRAFGEYGAVVIIAYHPFSLPVYTEEQFSATGLPATQAPTFLALCFAAAAVLVMEPHWSRRRRRRSVPPHPTGPPIAEPTAMAFDLDGSVGTFHLKVAYRAVSHRIAIVGPSGSGKSVTLRALAGLIPGLGSVHYGDRDVTRIAAEERHIGYVPQGLGLLPGRIVWRQVNFAVDAIAARAAWWLRTLHLEDLLDRLPEQLSGGQRQRVSLARALSRDPQVVFLDEPFSALDAPVRHELLREVRRLQHQAGLSTVIVTHDPDEAAILADEILVIAKGQLLQAGPCAEVFRRPASAEVARLLRIDNVLRGIAVGGGVIDVSEDAPGGTVQRCLVQTDTEISAGTPVTWCVRPNQIQIDPGGLYPVRVTDLIELGTSVTVSLQLLGGPELQAWLPSRQDHEVGSQCAVSIDPTAISVWAPAAAGFAPPDGEQPKTDIAPDRAAETPNIT